MKFTKRYLYIPAIFLLLILGIYMLQNVLRGNQLEHPKRQIILISVDTLRADHLPLYGYERNTAPNLSQLGKESIVYAYAYPNGLWTMPSHMSLLTGTLPSRHGVNKEWKTYMVDKKYPILNTSIKTIAEVLREHKFNTIKIAKLPDELGFGRGFNKDYNLDPFMREDGFDIVLKEIEHNRDRDFFMFIHTWMVHAPYTNSYFLRQKIKDKLGTEQLKFIDNFRNKPGGFDTVEFADFLKGVQLFDINNCIDLYDGGIYYVDGYIKKIIDKCKKLGIYDNVFFTVVADHGEHFGEHYPDKFYDQHGWDCYEEFIRIPFIIKFPHQFQTGVKNHPVSLVDYVPTVLDYYKIKVPDFVQGQSLLNGVPGDYIISEAASLGNNIERKMIRMGDLKYIVTMAFASNPSRTNWRAVAERRLFDLRADAHEKKNLVESVAFNQTWIRYEKLLSKLIEQSAEMNVLNKEIEIKEETRNLLKSLGYLR